MPTYSPTKNMPNFMPEYSVWIAGHQLALRLGQVERQAPRLGEAGDEEDDEADELRDQYHRPRWASTMSLRLNEPASITTPMSERPMKTS